MGGLQAQEKSKKEFVQLIASWVHTAGTSQVHS